jgi:photosystem II stability/assembly factor-like uncharacterized protein
LYSVQFVDESEGWAVGDEGVIWHTVDGGQSWERQASGVRASLRSVWFLDPFVGFVAGTEPLPGGGTQGVILATDDGGLKWRKLMVRELPGLHCVRFVDKKTGYVAGTGSELHPSGVFWTSDGGATWKAIAGEGQAGWLAADFGPEQVGVLGGRDGSLAALRPQGLLRAESEPIRPRGVRGVCLAGRDAWAVGEGGLVLFSFGSAGRKWTRADLEIPPHLAQVWDFHAVHVRDQHAWIAGRPGSVVLHTWDRGRNWQVQQTGQPLPLHGLWFVTLQRGWAVGDLGTILSTDDGGRTWKVQRRGGQRAAVLVFAGTATQVPWGTVAALGGEEGYLVAVHQVVAPVGPGASESVVRFSQAVRQAGGCQGETCWRFVRPPHLAQATASELARFWGDSQDESRGYEELIRQMVLAIRTWRPDVVLVPHPDPRRDDGQCGALVALAASKAFELAGQADAFPEQLAKLDLEPWTPSKLYGRWDSSSDAHVVVDLMVPQPRLQMTPAERAARACDCLPGAAAAATQEAYRLLASRLEEAAGHKHLLQGIKLAPGGQARREFPAFDWDEDAWQQVVQAAQRKRDLLSLGKQAVGDPVQARQLPAVLSRQLAELDEDRGAEAVFALGCLYADSGQWLLARETFLLMVDRYPAHRLTPEAARWLLRFGASSEARRREEMKHFVVAVQSPLGSPPEANSEEQGKAGPTRRPRPKAATALIRRQDDIREWLRSSLALGDILAVLHPRLYQQPDVQFCLRAAQRQLGQVEEPRLWYTQYCAQQLGGAWHAAAAAELWLLGRVGQSPKPSAWCPEAQTPPYLDGHLDDPCWTRHPPLRLSDAIGTSSEAYATEVWLARDASFLYLALRCSHPDNGHAKPPLRPRPRDADLDPFDRVSLLLDLDRDYATCFRLEVDQRGCVREDCWGDRSWNPKWYVAVHAEATAWQIEAAVPLTELTGEPIRPGQAWAFNLIRTIPGQGVQVFSGPSGQEPRLQDMGLLLFSGADPAPMPEPTPPPALSPAAPPAGRP